MTDKKTPPGKNPTPPADTASGKKPHATLNLKATEIKPPAPKEDPKAASGLAGSKPDTSSSASSGSRPEDKSKVSSSATGPDVKPTSSATRPDDKSAAAKPTATSTTAAGKSDDKAKDGPQSSKDSQSKSATSNTSAKPVGSPPPVRQSPGSGIGTFFSLLAAGLIGGFLALLFADSLQPQLAQIKSGLGIADSTQTSGDGVAKLSERLAAIEKAQGDSASGDTQPLAKQLAELENRIGELGSVQESLNTLKAAQDELQQKTAALDEQLGQTPSGGSVPDERIAKLEQQLATMTAFAESNENSGVVPRLAALTGRMADLEETLKNQIAAVRSGVSEDVETRLAKVSETSEAARSGTQRMDRQLSGVANDTARLNQQLETLKADTTRLGDTLRVVQEETAKMSSQLTGLEGDVTSKISKLASPTDVEQAVKPVAEQVSSLETQVANVVSAEKNRAQNAKRIVLALELGGLTRAIERGDGFAEELAQVKNTAGDLIDVSKLEPYETSGVASISKLQSMFDPVADAIIEASAAPAGDSVLDQLLANARSVVKIRKVSHDADDTSVEAVVSRIESVLAAGRLDEVLRLAKELPESGRQAANAWLKKVEERHGVDQALASVEEQLKASLSGTN